MPETAVRDYYDILGVSESASQDELRKAYLKLAQQYHPDKTGGDKAAEDKLKEINAAYDTLKNAKKRKEYDEARRNPFGAGFGGGSPFGAGGGPGSRGPGGFHYQTHGTGGAGGFDFEDSPFADLFGGIFGGGMGARQRGPRPGADKMVRLSIPFREAILGGKRSIQINQSVRGNGPEKIERRTVQVTIPAGAEQGMRLRLSGMGDPGGPGAPNGDLYVELNVQPDAKFAREDRNLKCEARVGFADAALGGKVRVPTLNGEAELRIPAGTQSGQTFRMRGQGVPAAGGQPQGDLLVRVEVKVPKRLSAEQREIIEQLRGVD